MSGPSVPYDTILRELGVDMDEFNTLAVPLTLAHKRWSLLDEPTDKQGKRSDGQQQPSTSAASGSKLSRHRTSLSCRSDHVSDRNRASEPTDPYTKIGKAYQRCVWELRFFLVWSPGSHCFSVDPQCESHVDTKLREFGFYEDATGKYRQKLAPRYSSFTTCEHGHQTSTTPAATPPSKPASKQIATPTTKAAPVKPAATPATTSSTPSASKSVKTSTTSSASQTNTSSSNTATVAKTADDKPASAAAAAKKSTASASAAAAKPVSARAQQKQPEQVQSATLLADCRKFASFRESNEAKRTHLSPNATLADVIRALNRAVLSSGVTLEKLENPIILELASTVALLNYAAVFYLYFADSIESYMQDQLGNTYIDYFFRAVYANRADCIEREEWRSSGSADAKQEKKADRAQRRQEIGDEFVKMVPDVTDLRDGVQTVLFTFVWINSTAFNGVEAAMAATLHNLIPLLQTIVVRCARQAYLMHRALTAARCISTINKVQPPGAIDLQWDLLDLSAALQNLSGCDLALFTSSGYSSHRSGTNTAKGRKKAGWTESVVSCPYTLHLYTAAVADMTFRTLLELLKAIESGTLSREPIPSPKVKCSKGCDCLSMDDKVLPIIEAQAKRLTLIERPQQNWTPKLVKGKKGNKKKKKRSAAAQSQIPKPKPLVQAKSGQDLALKEILWERIEVLKQLATIGQNGEHGADVGSLGAKMSQVEEELELLAARIDSFEAVVEAPKSLSDQVKAWSGTGTSAAGTGSVSSHKPSKGTPAPPTQTSTSAAGTTSHPTTPATSSPRTPPLQPCHTSCPTISASTLAKFNSRLDSLVVDSDDVRATLSAAFESFPGFAGVAELDLAEITTTMQVERVVDDVTLSEPLEACSAAEQQQWLQTSMVMLAQVLKEKRAQLGSSASR